MYHLNISQEEISRRAQEVILALRRDGRYHKENDIATFTLAAADTVGNSILNYRLILGGIERAVDDSSVFISTAVLAVIDTVYSQRVGTCIAVDGLSMGGDENSMSIDGFVNAGYYKETTLLADGKKIVKDRRIKDLEAQWILDQAFRRVFGD